jgi:DNA-binding PadR family transcriptional regulator
MLEFAILGLLQQAPMHGYELRKELAQVLGGLRTISFGSLYPALKRLLAAGYIATEEPDPQALLPADARLRILEGRRRTVEQQREGLRASLTRTRERLDRYTLELQRHGLESVDREVRWLNELIDSERRSAGAAPDRDTAPQHDAVPYRTDRPSDPPAEPSSRPGPPRTT